MLCCAGSRQLFLGDVQSGIKKFGALFAFLSQEVVLSPNRQHLDELPAQARENVLSVVAAYIPYYYPPGVSGAPRLTDGLRACHAAATAGAVQHSFGLAVCACKQAFTACWTCCWLWCCRASHAVMESCCGTGNVCSTSNTAEWCA